MLEVKKALLTIVLIMLLATVASAATREEFGHYIWLAKTGQLQLHSNEVDDCDHLDMNIYTVSGDYPVTKSPIFVMEITLLEKLGHDDTHPQWVGVNVEKDVDTIRGFGYWIEVFNDGTQRHPRILLNKIIDKEPWGIAWTINSTSKYLYRVYRNGQMAIFWEQTARGLKMWLVDLLPRPNS
jgi:hypothetical protein